MTTYDLETRDNGSTVWRTQNGKRIPFFEISARDSALHEQDAEACIEGLERRQDAAQAFADSHAYDSERITSNPDKQ